MTQNKVVLLGLDVGAKRIGVALADSIGRLSQPLGTVVADGSELQQLETYVKAHEVNRLVVGLPRNMSGLETQQTATVRQFSDDKLQQIGLPIDFQDESVTSVLAENELAKRKKGYSKGDIDAMAAAIILQDYLEQHYGRY